MALTKAEIYQRHKQRYHNDPLYRQKVLNQKRKYYLNKKTNDPVYMGKRKTYQKINSRKLTLSTKEYNMARPFQYAFRRLKMRAKQKNLPFDLTAKYLENLWTGKCAVFGTVLRLPYSTNRQVPDKATVDKVIPERGYVMGNVCWVSNKANIIKSYGTIEEHKLIVRYMKKFLP